MATKEKREQLLLLTLSKKQDYMTSDELAEILNISQKTVYRLIKKINQQATAGPLIISEKGRGYKLDYEKYISQASVKTEKNSDYSPVERRNRIMEELLLTSPKAKNVYQLFEEYYVGDSVIFSDEQAIADQLKDYHLTLERKQRTLAITGAEADIRRAIADLIQTLHTIDLDELSNVEASDFNNYDVLFVLEQIRMIEKDLAITIPYPYNVNIFSHLYILISRSRKVGLLKMSENNLLTPEENADLEKDLNLYHVAKATITNVEKYLHEKLPEIEIYYLYQYLASSRMQGNVSTSNNFSPKVTQITQLYLDEMAHRLKIPTRGAGVFMDLANHIKPMLNRLEHKIRVKNGLLEQIKITYEDIYQKVTAVSELVSEEFHLPTINPDENGFITLYFARIIETNQQPIKTLIMCTTGIGTSELLRAKIEKKFPELEVVDVVASRYSQENFAQHPDAQLILTTVNLKEDLPISTLLVSAMLTADDQNRIQRKIEEINHEG